MFLLSDVSKIYLSNILSKPVACIFSRRPYARDAMADLFADEKPQARPSAAGECAASRSAPPQVARAKSSARSISPGQTVRSDGWSPPDGSPR